MSRYMYFAAMLSLPAMMLRPVCAVADKQIAGYVTGMDMSARVLVIDGNPYSIPATLVSSVEAGRGDWGLALGSRVIATVEGPELIGIQPNDSAGRVEPIEGLPQ